jgi:hypothetical protein
MSCRLENDMEDHVPSQSGASNVAGFDVKIYKHAWIRTLVHSQLLAGAETTLAFVLSQDPILDLEASAKAEMPM